MGTVTPTITGVLFFRVVFAVANPVFCGAPVVVDCRVVDVKLPLELVRPLQSVFEEPVGQDDKPVCHLCLVTNHLG